MIADTSGQDRLLARAPNRRRLLVWATGAGAVFALVALTAPSVGRLLTANRSVSFSRLAFATVRRGPFVRDIAADGRVVAAVSPTLYAGSAGAVTVKVQAGDRVKQGQLLAVIDSPELTNELAQERATLDAMSVNYQRAQVGAREHGLELQQAYDSAKIDAAAAEREFQRNRKAFREGAVPERDVGRAKDALAKARLQLQQATTDLKLDKNGLVLDLKAKRLARDRQALRVQDLQRRVDDLAVRSPVSGLVGQLFVPTHTTVARDAKLLTVIDLSALELEVDVPEGFARDLAPGMAAEITGSGRTFNGVVNAISPEVVDGQVAARVSFVGTKPAQLRQNQRLSVRIVLDRRRNVLTVARGPFVDALGGNFAYVVRNGVAVKTPIRLGPSAIDKVEILQGLSAGDRIVVSGTENFNGAARVVISR